MLVLSHPTGNTFVRATARVLHQRGWLHELHTAIAAPSDTVLAWLPPSARRQLARRQFSEIPQRMMRTNPLRETVRLGAQALGARWLTAPGRWASVDAVYRSHDRAVANGLRAVSAKVTAVFAYEDGAHLTFEAARRLQMARIYELPIAYWKTTQRLLREEADRLPEWRATLGGLDDDNAKLARKDAELDQANVVIVPSRFVLESLPASVRESKRCIVARFGSPVAVSRPIVREPGRRLRVLFAGAMTQRKGLADVFAAVSLLQRRDIELVVMGTPLVPLSFYRQQCAEFTYEPPRSHAEVLALMRQCDVLVLPSLVEGRALVQQEALSCGLPLIVTRNAGAAELIVEGCTGYIVPERSPEAIARCLTELADDRQRLEEMRHAAVRAASAVPWSEYESCIASAVLPYVGARVAAAVSDIQ